MKYHAGMLNEYAIIQQVQYVQDALGGVKPDATVVEVMRVWVHVDNRRAGREYEQANQQHSEISHKVVARYTAAIKPNMHIVIKRRRFEILAVRNLHEMDRWIELDCKEIVEVAA